MTINKPDDRGKKRRDVKIEFVINPVPQEPVKKISEVQQTQLDIIVNTNFNLFNGRELAKWSRGNHKMWRAVLLPLDLISLHDMADGHWHADTLYIYPEDGYQSKLQDVSQEQFNGDEIHWVGGETAGDVLGTSEVDDKSYVILDAWWD